MNDYPSGDIRINGIASSNGGSFRQVSIDGMGTIHGDVTCMEISCNGTSKVEGNLRSERASINGIAKIKGAAHADQLRIDGKVTIQGKLTGEDIQVNGHIKIHGNCEAERFESNGIFIIQGMLNADIIEITAQGGCSAHEIVGEQITIKHAGSQFMTKLLGVFMNTHVTATTIEGDYISLEHATATVVRGGRISIGPDCIIERVEYKDELHIHPSSKVKYHTQI
ncbi:polymer-forming cytoskeletal protein [Paenibacillus terrigena]|uniref:polymer-forming cytoskeletal protein n=1 Tax=Paenibacillus terrigena TaxID=369333 RepID=UPI0028D7C536|nr:polymer-forming cytoskeletal protein [Paenibacillus terrigena]